MVGERKKCSVLHKLEKKKKEREKYFPRFFFYKEISNKPVLVSLLVCLF